MKVFITGAEGFIGSHLVDNLIKKNTLSAHNHNHEFLADTQFSNFVIWMMNYVEWWVGRNNSSITMLQSLFYWLSICEAKLIMNESQMLCRKKR